MKVQLQAQVHILLSSYVYSTDAEEVAMLLCGRFDRETAIVETCLFMTRKDKTTDRVEISSEQLSEALMEAESMGLKVIGWCHSHPKLTPIPSHIDVGTQLTFQTMEPMFFGLIYSCFTEKEPNVQRLQVIAFQSEGTKHKRIPLQIVPQPLNGPELKKRLGQISEKLLEEELLVQSQSLARENICTLRMTQLQDKLHLPLINYLQEASQR
ncbi:BRCA1/BRCA2-containing complex, subunit 3-like protein [Gorgonomyces haynaldii]|nr:BRCA1/BRCA2-containing complex, subunit 3-like protein [Gorgonomyces haynaldii]